MSIAVRELTKVYEMRDRAPQCALDNISFECRRGRLTTIVGPSGCGKTTLLRLIAGFEHATSGDVLHHGRRINDVPPYCRGFPMVFQSYALFPHMTVHENVRYGLRLRKVAREQLDQRVARMLSLLRLEDHAHKYPAQLSGGQQQRVALARALVLGPEVLLLDEPLSNLDASLRLSMRTEIRSLQRTAGVTAIYVTHDQEEALAISDEIVVMNEGRVEQIASPPELYQRPRTDFVARFMGCPNVFPIERTPHGVRLLGSEFVLPAATSARHVMLRSDAFHLRSDSEGRHNAVVEDATFLGSHVRYVLRMQDGTRITLDRPTAADPPLQPGATVYFDILLERLHFF